VAAAQVQQATLIRHKDIRKFLDGTTGNSLLTCLVNAKHFDTMFASLVDARGGDRRRPSCASCVTQRLTLTAVLLLQAFT
jgi:hypothetical protein